MKNLTLTAAQIASARGNHSMYANNDTYQGWANRETWLVNLWMSNEPRTYDAMRGLNAEAAESYVDSLISEMEIYDWTLDLIGAALARVNWEEIAESFAIEQESRDYGY